MDLGEHDARRREEDLARFFFAASDTSRVSTAP
jgi:hypothetical protein